MQFSYPNAKLLAIAHVAAQNGNCAKAVVSTARELGLIGSASLSELSCPLETNLCGSMLAARHVLQESLTSMGCQHLLDELWREIEEDFARYKMRKGLTGKSGCPSKQECYGAVSTIIETLLRKLHAI